jgi:Protein of unknown function (DUF3037)
MNRHVAHYTLARLLPQADAGEFANIGVVLACPERRFFDFRLIKRYARVTQFFEEFARPLFPKVRQEVQAELDYLKQRVLDGQAGAGGMMAVMTELVRPREAMIRYAPLRTLLTDDPAADLERLLARFVTRDGQEVQQRRELLMNQQIRKTLADVKLAETFKEGELGDDAFHVKLPFVNLRDGVAWAVIKPIDLAQDEPQKIYDHGDVWTQRLKRLQRLKQIGGGLLVPTQRPPTDDARRTKACKEIEAALRELGAEVTAGDDAAPVIAFARRYAA